MAWLLSLTSIARRNSQCCPNRSNVTQICAPLWIFSLGQRRAFSRFRRSHGEHSRQENSRYRLRFGYTSLYLSANENVVTAADPSLECCQVLEWNACRFGLNINIYQTTGEELESLPGEYDIALFHSSLHHMDNPLEALKQSRRKLKPGGTLFLIAESILKFFRSRHGTHACCVNIPNELGITEVTSTSIALMSMST